MEKEKERILAEINKLWLETIGYKPRKRKREPYRCSICGIVLDNKVTGWIRDADGKDYCNKCWERKENEDHKQD